MGAIFRREINAYFHNVIGWLYLAATLSLYGLYFFAYNLSYGYASISYSLNAISFIILITVPILTMRSLSEEQKSKTDQLIFTSPVTIGKIIVSKFLAMACIHTITTLVIGISPLVLQMFGTVSIEESYISILGFWLYGLAGIAIGMFVSSLTESQVIAAVLSFVLLFAGFMMPNVVGLISASGNILTKVLSSYDLITPLSTFFNGIISVTGIVYYLTIILLFLFLSTQVIQKRRWSVSAKKLKTGVFSSSFIVIAIALTLLVNLFVEELPSTIKEIDVTGEKLYSLTDETKEYLKDLDQEVTIYVLAQEDNLDATIQNSLNRMEDLSKQITVIYKDPTKYPNFATEYTDDTVSSGSLIVVSNGVSRVIGYSDLFESNVDYTTYQSTVTGYDGEGQIVSALQFVTSEDLPIIYQLEGHGETALAGEFKTAVTKANITLNSLNLLNVETVPEDAATLMINGPTSDFSEDDATKVIAYLNAGGNVIVTANYENTADMSNFNKVLTEYEVSLTPGLVAENDKNGYYQQPFYLIPTPVSTDYTSDVSGSYVFSPFTQAISYGEDTSNTTYTVLMSSSDQSVAKTDVNNATTYELEDGDTQGPFTLAVAVHRTIDEDTTAQLMVFGSMELFTDNANSVVSGANAKLFSQVITTLAVTDDSNLLVIPAKNYDASTLTVAAGYGMVMGIMVIVVLPLFLLLLGGVIWFRRRRR